MSDEHNGVTDEAPVLANRLLAVTAAAVERRAQLETALVSRVVIEQAKGILAERYGITIDDAFTLLRRAARSRRQKIHAVAAEIVASVDTPNADERLTSAPARKDEERGTVRRTRRA